MPFIYWLAKKNLTLGQAFCFVTLANLITHPLVVFWFMRNGSSYLSSTLWAESFAVVAEAAIYFHFGFIEKKGPALTASWVHSLRNSMGKCPARLSEAFKKLAHKVMYATSESNAREAFATLKSAMGTDAARAVRCIEKDLDSLVSHYSFKSTLWHALKTTNSVERINKEFKRRSKSMDSLGELRVKTLVAFTAMRLELGWRRRAVDTFDRQLLNRWGKITEGVDLEAQADIRH